MGWPRLSWCLLAFGLLPRAGAAQLPPPPPPPQQWTAPQGAPPAASWGPATPKLFPPVAPTNPPQAAPPPATLPPMVPPPPLPGLQVPTPAPPGHNPALDPVITPAGWFSQVEIGLVVPDLSGGLRGPVSVGGVPRTVALPFAELDWQGAPFISVGYQFAEQSGAVVFGFRSVVSQGTEVLGHYDPAGDGFLETRVNLTTFDLDYLTPTVNFAPFWDVSASLGVRTAVLYFDSQATGAILSQSASNHLLGAGPHLGLNVQRHLDRVPGLAAFAHLNGALIFAGVNQSFEEVHQFGGLQQGGASRFHEGVTAPVLGLQLGLSYTSQRCAPWLRFSIGYQYEQWWGVGDVGASHADFSVQGFFFRGEFRY